MPVAFVLITTEIGSVEKVMQSLLNIDEVSEVFSVSGPYSIIAKVETDSFEKLVKIIPEKIHVIDGISKTLTLIAFGVAREYRMDACEKALVLARGGQLKALYELCRNCKQLKYCAYGARTITFGL